ncbi:S1C family serine protease [Jannaschia ovalis]|uniref:Trypsin-like peptidase domain-containing protein n=1 Tax=Jannaschia ovalis TaxID=3038773 RepID=A0ABY8LE19_9RHOB|nr:trypsin-like peptidase domain-containing protein [Jannaschia sp. GRR-S6-38]WGH78540.1 trypsin-like peptidase domain-containing protein [Jannaschia sp. GRR-S6-38]
MRRAGLALALLAASFGGVLAWRLAPAIEAVLLDTSSPRPVAERGTLGADEAATIALFEAAQDSVVFIATSGVGRGLFGGGMEVPRGTGSGFVWDAAGHVVTNAHVIRGARRATVRLADGRSFDARLVGVSRDHDLAVLRVDVFAQRPRPLPIGRSEDLRVGQRVFAIGNPFGLDFTLTTGVVSALERELPGEEGAVIRGLVQTDAAINPGNSGGPLLDSAGRLVGVNTAIFSPSGASAGIGFAVPVDTVNRVVPQLIARGRYAPPSIGVTTDARLDAMARRQGLSGAMVVAVDPNGPASGAGLQPARAGRAGAILPGDRIVALDGTPIAGTRDLTAALDGRDVGEVVRLTLEGPGGAREVEVTLAPG